MREVKYGTYPATLTAADWLRILTALGAMRDQYQRLGLDGLVKDTTRTLDQLTPQVTEERDA